MHDIYHRTEWEVTNLAEAQMSITSTQCSASQVWPLLTGHFGEERGGQPTFPRKLKLVVCVFAANEEFGLRRNNWQCSGFTAPPFRQKHRGREEECRTFTWQMKGIVILHSLLWLNKQTVRASVCGTFACSCVAFPPVTGLYPNTTSLTYSFLLSLWDYSWMCRSHM